MWGSGADLKLLGVTSPLYASDVAPLSEYDYYDFFFFFKSLFVWLHRVSVASCGILVSCRTPRVRVQFL